MSIKYSETNLEDIVFSQLQNNAYIPSQRISWINQSDKSKLIIQKSKINYAYQKDCKQEASLSLIKIGSKNRITIS